MKFVEEHLKFHHLKKNPHKWFLAFLASPIHFAEMHYKKRYHLQFAHARKLFIFDMTLLLSLIAILGAGLFWWLYNPTVTDLVYLSIQKPPARILSGERLDFSINYKNESDVTLTSPKLKISLPDGYILEKTDPAENFDSENNTFTLKNLKSNEEGIVHIFGRIYETPHLDTHISADLIYKQEGKTKEEKKTTPFIAVLRGSVLKSNLEINDKILSQSTETIKFELKNEGDIEIKDISLPLNLPAGVTLLDAKTDKGNLNEKTWEIKQLDAEESAYLEGQINFNLKSSQKNLTIEFTPEIVVNEIQIPQETISKTLKVLHPNLSINSSWENGISQLLPGESTNVYFDIKNTGDTTLNNLQVFLPIADNILDSNKLIANNKLTIKNKTATIILDKNLEPGQSTRFQLLIPIKSYPTGGTDLTLSLEPQVQASVPAIKTTYKTSTITTKIEIGTSLYSTAEIRYYTKEGDQLGRGPIPPQVGEETKYWALIQMTNGTSRMSNLYFSATLPSYVKWTGKSSVSIGNDLNFDPQTRKISWNLNSLPANFTAGVYFELSITPDTSMINTNPEMLKNIYISGKDSFLDVDINKNLGNLDNSLKTDSIGQSKGSQVISF